MSATPTAEARITAVIDAATKARTEAVAALAAEQASEEPDPAHVLALTDTAAAAFVRATAARSMLTKIDTIAAEAERL